ncbi:hypothetical protein LBMAG12_02960 [Actinomycetes bacterium]|nr:hypothetical protein LBMAG12_02960 [Actinomycetes bacterium]
MKFRIAGTLVLCLTGFGTIVAVATAPPSNNKPEELEAIQTLENDEATAQIAKWLDRIASPPITDNQNQKIEISPKSVVPPTTPLPKVLELLDSQKLILVKLAEMWSPFEDDYLRVNQMDRSAMIVEFVRNNQPQLLRMMKEYLALESEISELTATPSS